MSSALHSQRFEVRKLPSEGQLLCLQRDINVWREQLHSVSSLGPFRYAGAERVYCPSSQQRRQTQRRMDVRNFFEAMFKSQSLLDEQALLSCLADTPGISEHTSIKKRIEAAQREGFPSNISRSREALASAISLVNVH